jgi:hypothetical protein
MGVTFCSENRPVRFGTPFSMVIKPTGQDKEHTHTACLLSSDARRCQCELGLPVWKIIVKVEHVQLAAPSSQVLHHGVLTLTNRPRLQFLTDVHQAGWLTIIIVTNLCTCCLTHPAIRQ